MIAALVGFVLLRLDILPPLINANTTDEAVRAAKAEVDHRKAELESFLRSAPLDGQRGDFEQRGLGLLKIEPSRQREAALRLASDVRLIERIAQARERYWEALAAYDAALMARTRDLGSRGEMLRSYTWPIVEHVKLYPPPHGQNTDFRPPNAATIAVWAASIEQGADGDIDKAVAAAKALGRSTFAFKQLLSYDARYGQVLDEYASRLARALQAEQQPELRERILAGLVSLFIALLLGRALMLLATAPVEHSTADKASRATDLTAQDSAAQTKALVLAASAAAIYYVLPGLPAALGGAGLLLFIFMRWPATALALIPAAIPFYYRPRHIDELLFTLTEVLILLAVGAALLRVALTVVRQGWGQVLAWWGKLLRSPIIWGAALILLGALLSFGSPLLVDRHVALRELRRTIIEPLLFLALLSIARPRERTLALWGFTISAAFVAGDALVRLLLGNGTWAMEGVPRLIGLLPSSTALGIILGAALASVVAMAYGATDRQQRHAAILLAVPLALATILTFTRGAWLGVAAAGMTMLALRRSWRLLLLLGLGVCAALGTLSLLSAERFRTMFSLNEGTGAARLEIWAAALRLLRASPLTGIGLDQFVHQDPQRFGIPHVRLLYISHPHNMLLDLWLQVGLLGLLAALWVAGLALWRLIRKAARADQRGGPLAIAALAAVAMLVDLLVHGMLDQALMGADMIVLFWACVAQALPDDAFDRHYQAGRTAKPPAPPVTAANGDVAKTQRHAWRI